MNILTKKKTMNPRKEGCKNNLITSSQKVKQVKSTQHKKRKITIIFS